MQGPVGQRAQAVAQGELQPKALSQRFPPARPCFQTAQKQQDGGFHQLENPGASARDAQRFTPRFPPRAGAESSQSQRPLVWAFSSRMSPAFIFDKCSEDTKFIACLHKENFFSLLKRKLPEQTPPRTRCSQPRLFYLPRSWIFMAQDCGIVIITHNKSAFQF